MNDLYGVGFFSITSILPGYEFDVEKTVDLYFEGKLTGNIQIKFRFFTSEPEKFPKKN